mmetsp:Transcript_15200/g.17997  ORF Transcript_15200/g.17997 Transcript_15200/m.17997 type:complete len:88 (+) Transcript_15200:94-357(+)
MAMPGAISKMIIRGLQSLKANRDGSDSARDRQGYLPLLHVDHKRVLVRNVSTIDSDGKIIPSSLAMNGVFREDGFSSRCLTNDWFLY